MDTKVVTPPERTLAVLPTREIDVPAAQGEDSAAKLETAGNTYLSPVVRIDNETQTAVLLYRDPQTGKVLRQFPPKAASETYAQTERRHKEEVELKPVQAPPAPKGEVAQVQAKANDQSGTHADGPQPQQQAPVVA